MSPIGKASGASAPVDFKRVWTVNQAGSAGAVRYTSIQQALDAIAALPSEEQPSISSLHVIEVHPGLYQEFIWLPDWVSLKSLMPATAILQGSGSGSDKAILSVGLGAVDSMTLLSATSPDATAGVFLRNITSAFTDEESFTIGNGDTLIITPRLQSQETFTFAGTETTAQNVVDLINATAVNLLAIMRFGRVELIHTATPKDNGLIIHKEGTVNAALGFSTTTDLNTDPPNFEVQFLNRITIASNVVDGLLCTDRGGGLLLMNELIVFGVSGNGVHVEANSVFAMTNPFVFLNPNGIVLDAGSELQIMSGRSILNFTQDLVIASTAELIANNFVYARRPSTGTLIPSGTRLSFVWEVVGNLTTGIFIDGGRTMPFDMTIESVTMWRGVAGTPATDLIVDLNKAAPGGSPATIYTTQANRPKITSDGTDNETELAALPDVLNIAQGEFLSIDIDAVEAGLSQHLNFIVTGVVN